MNAAQYKLIIATLGVAFFGGWWLAPAVTGLMSIMSVKPVIGMGLLALGFSLDVYIFFGMRPSDCDDTEHIVCFCLGCIGIFYIGMSQSLVFFMLPFVVVHVMHSFGDVYRGAYELDTFAVLKLLMIVLAVMVELAHVVAFVCALFLMFWFCWFVPSTCILLCFVLNTVLMHCSKLVTSANRKLKYNGSFRYNGNCFVHMIPSVQYPLDTPLRVLSDYCTFIFKGVFLSTSFTQYLCRNALIDVLDKMDHQTAYRDSLVHQFETL